MNSMPYRSLLYPVDLVVIFVHWLWALNQAYVDCKWDDDCRWKMGARWSPRRLRRHQGFGWQTGMEEPTISSLWCVFLFRFRDYGEDSVSILFINTFSCNYVLSIEPRHHQVTVSNELSPIYVLIEARSTLTHLQVLERKSIETTFWNILRTSQSIGIIDCRALVTHSVIIGTQAVRLKRSGCIICAGHIDLQ